MHMRTSWWIRSFVVAMTASMVGIVGMAMSALAAPPLQVGGTFNFAMSPLAERSADGNTFVSFSFVESIHGALEGTRTGTGELVVHPDGTINAKDSGVFIGTVDGVAGTAVLRVSGSGSFVAIAANFSVSDGAGGLAGVHVEGKVAGSATGPASFAGTYSSQVHWSDQ